MQDKYNVAIVGYGVIAQQHLEALKKLDQLKVVAICDIDEKKASTASKKWKLDHYYSDFSKMLSNEDISILSILTPPSSHAFLAIEAIKNGINVLIEKPFTMTTKEADSIISALRKSRAKMTVVYHWLFRKAMLESLSLIREQKIGEVLNVNVQVCNTKEDPMTSDPNHWSHRLPGGRFGENLPHPIYVLQSLLGDNLQIKNIFVSKRGNFPWMPNDELHAILQGKKSLGSLYVSFNAPRPWINVDVYGTKEILKIDLTKQTVLRLGPMLGRQSKFTKGKDSLSIASKITLSTIRNALEFSLRKRGQYDRISNVYRQFTNSIKMDIEPLVTPEMAYNTVRIEEEIIKRIQMKG